MHIRLRLKILLRNVLRNRRKRKISRCVNLLMVLYLVVLVCLVRMTRLVRRYNTFVAVVRVDRALNCKMKMECRPCTLYGGCTHG